LIGRDPAFSCGFFSWEPFRIDELLQYDVLVFIKYYPSHEILAELKKQGKKLILDYQDMFLYPSVYELNKMKKLLKQIYYHKLELAARRQLSQFDLCFVASPTLPDIVRASGIKPYFLQRQLYNDHNEENCKKYDIPAECPIIYWTGVTVNQPQNLPVLPILKMLKERYGCRIIFSSDSIGSVDFVEYRIWNRDSWEDELTEVDIAFRWRDTSNMQRCKDANKVMSYMGAALPVVIYPTESEKLIMEDGVTGFMAYSPEQFENILVKLVQNPDLRKSVGLAAHREVWLKYSLNCHVGEIKKVLSHLVSGR